MFSLCISPSKFLHVIPHSAHVSQPLPGKIWWHNTLYSVDHLKASSDRKTIGSTKSKHSLLLWPNSAGKHLQTVVISINEIQCEIQSSFHVDTHGHRGNFDGVISLHREHICRGSHAIVDATLINPVTLTSIETPLLLWFQLSLYASLRVGEDWVLLEEGCQLFAYNLLEDFAQSW